MIRRYLATCLAGLFAVASCLPAFAETGHQKQKRKELEIPHCERSLGTVAIHEPDTDWWTKMELGSPTAIIKTYVAQSGCFKLVDRGAGMQAAEQERAYAAKGTLRRGSNIGAGQVRAADYILVPDLVTHNQNAGGNAIGGLLGVLIPGVGGVIASGINFNSKNATTTLALTSVRSSEQVAVAEGHAKKTDVSWGGGAGAIGSTGIGGIGGGSYNNTEAGQVIALSFLDAYISLVHKMGGLPDDAAQAAAPSALVLKRQGRLFSAALPAGKPLGGILDPGTRLYPTGKKDGDFLEVMDDLGHAGWISSYAVNSASDK